MRLFINLEDTYAAYTAINLTPSVVACVFKMHLIHLWKIGCSGGAVRRAGDPWMRGCGFARPDVRMLGA